MSFEIHLPLFDGPFDLLLFFIERDELDIYDIPIAKITRDFQDYLQKLEEMNLEVASEFILVAAQLIRIKAKMLLPRPELDSKGHEIDPREELVQHLLEYKRYKEASLKLVEREADRIARLERGNVEAELKIYLQDKAEEAEWESVDLYKLMKVFQRVMQRYENQQAAPKHVIVQYPYTVEGQGQALKELMRTQKRLSFETIIAKWPEKIALVFNFLAILEMVQLQEIDITVGEGFNNFWISPKKQNS